LIQSVLYCNHSHSIDTLNLYAKKNVSHLPLPSYFLPKGIDLD
jgi:hypothetical protein